MDENLSKYQDAFIEAFELEDKNLLSDLKYQSIDEWDSIGHMALMAELESAFDITIKTEDLIVFESYKQGVDILARYDIIVKIPVNEKNAPFLIISPLGYFIASGDNRTLTSTVVVQGHHRKVSS